MKLLRRYICKTRC